MKRLLIGYDGSASAENMLGELKHTGLPDALEVLVLSVADVWLPLDTGDAPPPGSTYAIVERSRREARRVLAETHTLASSAASHVQELFPKWRVQADACAEAPAWAIIRRAEQWNADLIAIGSQGHGMLERIFLGSVSQKVVAEAHCSVHVSRTKSDLSGPVRLMVAVDGSSESTSAIQAVSERQWSPGTQCHLVSVVDPRLEAAVAVSGAFDDYWVHSDRTEVQDALKRMIEDAARRLTSVGLIVETHVLSGEPKQILAKESIKLGVHLLFLGAHGLHHLQRYFLGTVASTVTARAHCSVEVIRAAKTG